MAPVSCQFILFPQGSPSRELTWECDDCFPKPAHKKELYPTSHSVSEPESRWRSSWTSFSFHNNFKQRRREVKRCVYKVQEPSAFVPLWNTYPNIHKRVRVQGQGGKGHSQNVPSPSLGFQIHPQQVLEARVVAECVEFGPDIRPLRTRCARRRPPQ